MTPGPTQRFIPASALIAAAAEPMSPFDHADASLASGPPFPAVAEPALLLFAFALGVFGGAIGNADALHAFCLHRHLVLGGVECGICRDQARSATEPCLMGFDGSDQQVRIAGTPIVDFVVGHNLIHIFSASSFLRPASHSLTPAASIAAKFTPSTPGAPALARASS